MALFTLADQSGKIKAMVQNLERYGGMGIDDRKVQGDALRLFSRISELGRSQKVSALKNKSLLSTMFRVLSNTDDPIVFLKLLESLWCLVEKIKIGRKNTALHAVNALNYLFQFLSNEASKTNTDEIVVILHKLLAKIGQKDRKFAIKARLTQSLGVTSNHLRLNVSNMKNLIPILNVIRMTSSNGVNASVLGKDGIMHYLLRVLQNSGKRYPTASLLAIQSVHSLVKLSKSNCKRITEIGGVPYLLALFCQWQRMDTKNSQMKIRRTILLSLKHIIYTKAGSEAFREADGIRVLYTICQTILENPDLEGLLILACAILQKSLPQMALPLDTLCSPIHFNLPESDFHPRKRCCKSGSHKLSGLGEVKNSSATTAVVSSDDDDDDDDTSDEDDGGGGAQNSGSGSAAGQSGSGGGMSRNSSYKGNIGIVASGKSSRAGSLAGSRNHSSELFQYSDSNCGVDPISSRLEPKYIRTCEDLAQYEVFFPELTEFGILPDVSSSATASDHQMSPPPPGPQHETMILPGGGAGLYRNQPTEAGPTAVTGPVTPANSAIHLPNSDNNYYEATNPFAFSSNPFFVGEQQQQPMRRSLIQPTFNNNTLPYSPSNHINTNTSSSGNPPGGGGGGAGGTASSLSSKSSSSFQTPTTSSLYQLVDPSTSTGSVIQPIRSYRGSLVIQDRSGLTSSSSKFLPSNHDNVTSPPSKRGGFGSTFGTEASGGSDIGIGSGRPPHDLLSSLQPEIQSLRISRRRSPPTTGVISGRTESPPTGISAAGGRSSRQQRHSIAALSTTAPLPYQVASATSTSGGNNAGGQKGRSSTFRNSILRTSSLTDESPFEQGCCGQTDVLSANNPSFGRATQFYHQQQQQQQQQLTHSALLTSVTDDDSCKQPHQHRLQSVGGNDLSNVTASTYSVGPAAAAAVPGTMMNERPSRNGRNTQNNILDSELYSKLAVQTKHVALFHKLAFPDVFGSFPYPRVEPQYEKPFYVLRSKLFEDVERMLAAADSDEYPNFVGGSSGGRGSVGALNNSPPSSPSGTGAADTDDLTPRNMTVFDLDEIIRSSFSVPDRLTNYDRLRIGIAHSDTTRLVFNSQFESGNLRKAIQVQEFEYDLILNPDINTNSHHQWFNFQISNMRNNIPYRFNIVNCIKPNSQFNTGMQPVMYSVTEALAGRPYWQRVGDHVCYYKNHFTRPPPAGGPAPAHPPKTKASAVASGYCSATFSISFRHAYDICYIAYHYPYTYTTLITHLRSHEQTIDYSQIFYCNQLLCKTLGGNSLPLLTITARPNHNDPLSLEQFAQRPYIFLTARVHPGESNASWMMKGTIDYLLSDAPTARSVREAFIFKIVPMLNPDGVINGSHRCSLSGEDLNRTWISPCPKLHPTIFHTKGLLEYMKIINKRPMVFCDYHGHSRRKNVFLYGCSPLQSWIAGDAMNPTVICGRIEDNGYKTLPRLLTNIVPAFSLNNCSFVVEKDREATARVVVWRQIGIVRSYTMESTYCGCDQGYYKNFQIGPREHEETGAKFCESLLRMLTKGVVVYGSPFVAGSTATSAAPAAGGTGAPGGSAGPTGPYSSPQSIGAGTDSPLSYTSGLRSSAAGKSCAFEIFISPTRTTSPRNNRRAEASLGSSSGGNGRSRRTRGGGGGGGVLSPLSSRPPAAAAGGSRATSGGGPRSRGGSRSRRRQMAPVTSPFSPAASDDDDLQLQQGLADGTEVDINDDVDSDDDFDGGDDADDDAFSEGTNSDSDVGSGASDLDADRDNRSRPSL